MKNKLKWLLVVAALLFARPVNAAEFTASYDYYIAPNSGNNYDNGQGFTLGLKHGIYKDLSGHAGVSYITDIDFPSVDDPKGSFGELRGYAAIYSLIYDLKYNDRLTFNLSAGGGATVWDFRENPFLQDHGVIVEVDPSIVFKAGVGAEYRLKDDWTIGANVGWLDTNIEKHAEDKSGKTWNILDAGDNIGLQYITATVQVKKKY